MILNLLKLLNPEQAHSLTIQALKIGISPNYKSRNLDNRLVSNVFGLEFPNPVGIAAGFDKSAEAFDSLCKLGTGFVEVGTLTLRSQTGNDRPRVFRLKEDQAIINRYGFNNHGLNIGIKRITKRRASSGIIGINIGINKNTSDPIGDYAKGLILALPIADYITINISSPNTPGLRDLQTSEKLEELLNVIKDTRQQKNKDINTPPILVKLAPDLSELMIKEIVEIAVKTGISGLIISNTTTERPKSLKSKNRSETGGLSGPPVFALSTKKLAQTYLACNGRLPLVGVGGVDSAETAYAKIRAGANLVQLYTALTYSGPSLFHSINEGLSLLVKNDNFTNVQDAVGVDAKHWATKVIPS
jgi:dihydroorotate dehydrogenase